jgi:hypothetical protein
MFMTKTKPTKAHSYLLAILAIFAITFSDNSKAEYNLFEVTRSTNSKTFDQISTIGFYSTLGKKHGETSYGGVQLAFYEHTSNLETDSIARIIFGQKIEGLISPFFEVGTDLYGFLVILSDSDNRQNCKDNRECTIDVFFRVGIRIKIYKQHTLGIFHENIDFGDFHSNLVGEHNYTGASLGFNF